MPESSLGLPTFSRRRFLAHGAALGGGALVAGVPALVRSARPELTHGVQSGDVSGRAAVVWARANRTSRMLLDVDTSDSFRNARRLRGPVARRASDFTAQLELEDLPRGEEVFFRVRFVDLDDDRVASEARVGRFRTAPSAARPRDVSFVWSGDTAGQGWGINPDFGGMRLYETMRSVAPDFFVHSGDTIYADNPIEATVPLPGGGVWRNITTPEKSKVAETLDEFRANYKYNLLDTNLLRFNSEVPTFAQWDDHETVNNWYPGEVLDDPRYSVTDVDRLAARAQQAFIEYMPLRERPRHGDRIYRKIRYGPSLEVFFLDMRTYRGPNTSNDQRRRSDVTDILDAAQLRWLRKALLSSTATWKVIASDMPIGLVVPDAETTFEAVANSLDGRALGRELEIAALLSFIKRRAIANVVWLTADVHYTAAHHYDPERARFRDFDPFWEFVSGPINAGTFGPNELDATFGPEVRFSRFAETPNLPPSAGLQFFGHVTIDSAGDTMTVRLKDLSGATLYSVVLEARR